MVKEIQSVNMAEIIGHKPNQTFRQKFPASFGKIHFKSPQEEDGYTCEITMEQVKECLLEVETFADNDSLGKNRKKAFVKAYIPASIQLELQQVLSESCEFMGYKLTKIAEVKDATENDIPKEAISGYKRFNAGFGTFHSFPIEE